MKKLLPLFTIASIIACNNSSQKNEQPVQDSASKAQEQTGADPVTVLFNITDEEALRLVSEIEEINKELKRTFKDTTVRNQLVLVQPASPEDTHHYIQLMEMHDDRGVTLAHFRVDAMTGEIRVMDPLSEEETWVTLEQWRKIKL